MNIDKKTMVYGAAIIIAIVAVAVVASRLTAGSYSLRVAFSTNTKGTVYPYQTSRFTINVSNTGSAQISNLVVSLYQNGAELKHYTVTVPGYQSITLQYNQTYTYSGNFSFKAVADPGRLLNIPDRNGTQGSLAVKVSTPEVPNVYASVPNGNVTGTQSFSLSGTGLYAASAVAQEYNLKAMDRIFGPSKNIVATIFDNIYGFVAYSFGASVDYADGASAYVVWLQGTADPGVVDYIVSTFRVHSMNTTVNGTAMSVARADNKTSLCTFYSNGWTKMVAYYNNSMNGTCLSLLQRTYQPTESNTLVDALNSSNDLTLYQSEFMYRNSSKLGTSLLYSNSSIGVMDLFQNGYGFFASYVQKNRIADLSNSTTCKGIVYNSGSTHVCSYLETPANTTGQRSYGLVNTTAITKDYIVTIYSLVNESNLLPAHQNGGMLISLLKVNESSIPLVQAIANRCMLNGSTGISCRVNQFDYLNNTVNLSITNMLNSQVRISNIACRKPGMSMGYAVNEIVGAGSNVSVVLPCYNIVPVPVAVESYNLVVNYTQGNASKRASGILNITTAGFP